MNIALLIAVVLTLAPVHMGREVFLSGNSMTSDLASSRNRLQPCQSKSHNNQYDIFAKRHIVRDMFDRSSKDAWKSYLKNKDLCGRAPVQSFIEAKNEQTVKEICSSLGRRLVDRNRSGNLCISEGRIQMYNVESSFKNRVCRVKSVTGFSQHVIVACNKVANRCLPVHFEKYKNQMADNKPCTTSA